MVVNKSPVNSDSRNGEGGYKGDTDRPHSGQMTQPLSFGTNPTFVQDFYQSQWTKDRAEQQVAYGQVDNQNVVNLEMKVNRVQNTTLDTM